MASKLEVRALRMLCDLQQERDKALRKADDYAEACRICNLQNSEAFWAELCARATLSEHDGQTSIVIRVPSGEKP